MNARSAGAVSLSVSCTPYYLYEHTTMFNQTQIPLIAPLYEMITAAHMTRLMAEITWKEFWPLLPHSPAMILFKKPPASRNSVWLELLTIVSHDFPALAA